MEEYKQSKMNFNVKRRPIRSPLLFSITNLQQAWALAWSRVHPICRASRAGRLPGSTRQWRQRRLIGRQSRILLCFGRRQLGGWIKFWLLPRQPSPQIVRRAKRPHPEAGSLLVSRPESHRHRSAPRSSSAIPAADPAAL